MTITQKDLEEELVELQALKDRYVEDMRKYTEVYDTTRHIFDNSSSVVGMGESLEKIRNEYLNTKEQSVKDIASLDRVILILGQLKELLK